MNFMAFKWFSHGFKGFYIDFGGFYSNSVPLKGGACNNMLCYASCGVLGGSFDNILRFHLRGKVFT